MMLLKTGRGSLLRIYTGSSGGMLRIEEASPCACFAPTLCPHRLRQTPINRLPTADAATATLSRLSGVVRDEDCSLCAEGEDHSSLVH